MTGDLTTGRWLAAVGLLILVAACGSSSEPDTTEPAVGTSQSHTPAAAAVESTTSTLLETTDGSIVRAPRRIEDGPVVAFPTSVVDPDAAWTPPVVGQLDVNMTVVPASIEQMREIWDGQTDVAIELFACVQIAPAVWLLSGSIDVPEDGSSVVLELIHESSDVQVGWAVATQVLTSGVFSVVLDSADVLADQRGRRLFNGVDCLVRVNKSGPTLRIDSMTPTGGLVWDAPEGSVHELGMGADLGDWYDPGRGWAEANWANDPMPFASVLAVIPEPGVRVLDVYWNVSAETACRTMNVTVQLGESTRSIDVNQWRDCPVADRIGPVDEGGLDDYPGIRIASHGPGTWKTIYGSLADSRFSISAPTLEEATAVLTHLELRPNLWVAELPESPFTGEELEAVIASAMEAEGGVELTRVVIEDGWLVLARVTRNEEVGEGVFADVELIVEYTVRNLTDRWVVQESGGGTVGSCVYYSGSATGFWWVEYVVLEDPSWHLEVFEDGQWSTVEATNGAYMISGSFAGDDTIENWTSELEFRVTDETGAPPACAGG